MVSQPASSVIRPTCKFKRENGEFCRRNVAPGETRCWQHAKSWRHKWKSLTGNQTVAFCGLIVGLALAAPGLYFSYVSWRDSRPRRIQTETQKPGSIKSASEEDGAQSRFHDDPDHLTLHDLFLIDSRAVQQSSRGSVFVDDNKTISVEYSINTDLGSRSKFLSFYIARQEHTSDICEYLARQYKFILDHAPQLLVEQKSPGDSGTISTKEAVFSNRIYIYHETYLPAETTVKLTAIYKDHSVSAIFRSTDYLSTKRMEATLQKLRRDQAPP